MLGSLQLLTAALPLATAFPALLQETQASQTLEERASPVYPKVPPPKFTTNRDNCGSHGHCTVFNAKDQFVDVRPNSGHAFKAPGPNDLRGQCPGLNAAANHGFLPRNGIVNILETIEGLGAAYSMSKELAGGLAVIAIGLAGDPIAETWSIGSGYKGTLGLLGEPTGIVGTHNRYEGDSSIVKGDAYLHGGNVGVFEMHKWERIYKFATSDRGYTQDDAANQAYYTSEYSVLNNPYYFSEPFSGLVAPDAHNFVAHLMSNRSEAHKGGLLHGDVLKSFFAVSGTPGNFKHHEGQERIPYEWYKRPSSQPMDAVDTNVDTVINSQMYPGVIRFGGNTGKTNSFAGIDLKDLTGGVYNGQNIFTGNNLACFFYQASQAGLTDASSPLVESAAKIKAFIQKNLAPQLAALNCPQLKDFNNGLFKKYPGASYTGQS